MEEWPRWLETRVADGLRADLSGEYFRDKMNRQPVSRLKLTIWRVYGRREWRRLRWISVRSGSLVPWSGSGCGGPGLDRPYCLEHSQVDTPDQQLRLSCWRMLYSFGDIDLISCAQHGARRSGEGILAKYRLVCPVVSKAIPGHESASNTKSKTTYAGTCH